VLARLFTKPSNLLVLDEPTNDLDLETLELLEDYLTGYTGTIIMVSHDRAFINNIVTSTLVFEGNGTVKEYVGGYDDWLRQRPAEIKPLKPVAAGAKPEKKASPVSKFGFRQQKELDSLPEAIQALETEHEQLFRDMGDPALYKRDKSELEAKKQRLEAIKESLVQMYLRWQELERLQKEATPK
jgi:ATP-binding cassette subfamily F protein uup